MPSFSPSLHASIYFKLLVFHWRVGNFPILLFHVCNELLIKEIWDKMLSIQAFIHRAISKERLAENLKIVYKETSSSLASRHYWCMISTQCEVNIICCIHWWFISVFLFGSLHWFQNFSLCVCILIHRYLYTVLTCVL